MSNYRPSYSANQYNYHPAPNNNFPPPPIPQYAQQYPLPNSYPPDQQPPYYPPATPQQPQPYSHHATYNPNTAPSPGLRGMQFHSFSSTPSTAYSAPMDHPPPQPMPQMYWPPQSMASGTRFPSESEKLAREAAAAVFDRFDGDRSGYLDLQEFMDALRALHLAISYHDALDCFAECDANEDGRIGRAEFVNKYIHEMKKRC